MKLGFESHSYSPYYYNNSPYYYRLLLLVVLELVPSSQSYLYNRPILYYCIDS